MYGLSNIDTLQGSCKLQNEIEMKRSQSKRNVPKRNQKNPKFNIETKLNQIMSKVFNC